MQAQAHQTQAQPQSPSYNSPTLIEAHILDHESRLQSLVAGHDQIVDHLKQLAQFRQQQKAESDCTNASHKTEIASLRSYIWLCLVGMLVTSSLALVGSVLQNQQINQLQEKLNVRPHQGSIQAQKN